MSEPKHTPGEEKLCTCGHTKDVHYHGSGMCESTVGKGYSFVCNCRRFRKAALAKAQPLPEPPEGR